MADYLAHRNGSLVPVKDTGTELVRMDTWLRGMIPRCACGKMRPVSARTCGDPECITALARVNER